MSRIGSGVLTYKVSISWLHRSQITTEFVFASSVSDVFGWIEDMEDRMGKIFSFSVVRQHVPEPDHPVCCGDIGCNLGARCTRELERHKFASVFEVSE